LARPVGLYLSHVRAEYSLRPPWALIKDAQYRTVVVHVSTVSYMSARSACGWRAAADCCASRESSPVRCRVSVLRDERARSSASCRRPPAQQPAQSSHSYVALVSSQVYGVSSVSRIRRSVHDDREPYAIEPNPRFRRHVLNSLAPMFP